MFCKDYFVIDVVIFVQLFVCICCYCYFKRIISYMLFLKALFYILVVLQCFFCLFFCKHFLYFFVFTCCRCYCLSNSCRHSDSGDPWFSSWKKLIITLSYHYHIIIISLSYYYHSITKVLKKKNIIFLIGIFLSCDKF